MRRFGFAAGAAACVLTFSAAAQARVVALEIDKTEPFAAGTSFGAAGEYVRITGKARGELDPNLPVNKGIVNLDKAPRNARGMVEYETDIFILRPADPAKGNGRMLYEVNNRGRKFLNTWLMDAPPVAAGAINDPRTAEHAGNGLFLRLGYTIVWSGWDPDAPRAGNGMAMTVPVATNNGQPIVHVIRDELVSGTRGPQVDAFRLSYSAASLDQSQAKLTVRRKEAYAKIDIPASGWAYVDARAIKLLPDGTKPEPGALYEFTYPARDPKVLGIGYAATRDVVSFLRYAARDDAGNANPVGAPIRHVLGVGISQSGRYLRDHISQGFNQDEAKRKVFDGMLAHISGIGRVFHNAEFGQPFRTNTQHEDHAYPENEFPFAAATLKDPVTGKTGSLLRGDGFDPLLIEVNTSTEYWQKGASLLHTDPLGRRDVALDKTARVFMVAGTQHGGRAGLTTAPGPCVNPRNPHSAAPALRALIVALDEWVVEGRAPPASLVPTIKAGTLVAPDKTGFPAIPGAAVVREVNQIALFGDWVQPDPQAKSPYRPLVAKVDAGGNEVAGIRLPDIAVPVGTYTGWNLYKAPFPEGELCDRDGSFLPFAKTKAERMAKGDPRPSLEELYGDHAGYMRRVEAVAATLVRQRLLLREDADRIIERARRIDPFKS
jgi:hypothetical protein